MTEHCKSTIIKLKKEIIATKIIKLFHSQKNTLTSISKSIIKKLMIFILILPNPFGLSLAVSCKTEIIHIYLYIFGVCHTLTLKLMKLRESKFWQASLTGPLGRITELLPWSIDMNLKKKKSIQINCEALSNCALELLSIWKHGICCIILLNLGNFSPERFLSVWKIAAFLGFKVLLVFSHCLSNYTNSQKEHLLISRS